MLGRLALVQPHADRFRVIGRALAIKIGVAQIVEAHGAHDAIAGQGEIEEERHAVFLEPHALERQG